MEKTRFHCNVPSSLSFVIITNHLDQSEVPQREFGRTGVFGLEEMHLFVVQNKDLFAKVGAIFLDLKPNFLTFSV